MTDDNDSVETDGEYNPSGGIPSHPADPHYEDASEETEDETTDETETEDDSA